MTDDTEEKGPHPAAGIEFSRLDGGRVETEGCPADGDFQVVFAADDATPRAMASVGRDRANLVFAARPAGETVAPDAAPNTSPDAATDASPNASPNAAS